MSNVTAFKEIGLDLELTMILLHKMFKKTVVIDMVNVRSDKLFITISDSITGSLLIRPKVGPNIKNNATLGYYYSEYDLCIMPMRDKTFMLKKGLSGNKEIRPLFHLDKKRS